MKKAALPKNEKERLATLRRYEVLDTCPELPFDDLTILASYICETPIAAISLIDADRQWFKSITGLNASETPRDHAFCAHTILESELLCVEDATLDSRFKDNPLVIDEPKIRFYAGAPLITPSGHAIGALCAIDSVPRKLGARQLDALKALARQVVHLLESQHYMRQRQQTEAALKESADRLQVAITGSSDGIWDWTDVSKENEWWSPRFYELLGYKEGEIPATLSQWYAMLHPDDRHRTDQALQAHFEYNEPFNVEYRLRTKQGNFRWFRARAETVRDASGKPLRMAGSIADITRKKIVQTHLQTALQSATQATLAKSQFLANMSHEIRTPMNGVIGMLNLLRETELTKDQQKLAQTALSSAESLLAIINDVLDYSKIDAGKLELSVSEFNLKALTTDLEILFAPHFKEKQLNYQTVLPPTVPLELQGDAHRLRQVLLNLIGNATKFTPEKQAITLTIAELKRDATTVVLEFAVTDTGIGISPQKQQEIFQAFQQGDASVSREFGGTGLGLTISSRLVKMMGGNLTVESAVGKGSTFRFAIALNINNGRPAAAAKENHSHAVKPQRSTRKVKPLSILVAEDNTVNQLLIRRMLEQQGHQLTLAPTGQHAVDLWGKNSFDLILMDVQMPILDGIQATTLIREAERNTNNHIPIIALTAHAMAGDRERFLEAGMDGYVSKPVDKHELFETIASVCDS